MNTYDCGHPDTPENTVTVRDTYRYCRLCNQQSANRRYRAKNPGARQKSFLSFEDKLASLLRKTPDHWLWQGEMRDGSIAVCSHDRVFYFVASLLWERERGPVPPGHCLYAICMEPRCVRPACRHAAKRGSHITYEQKCKRWDASPRPEYRPIHGMSPERAAIFGLIDVEQYLARYRLGKRKRGAAA